MKFLVQALIVTVVCTSFSVARADSNRLSLIVNDSYSVHFDRNSTLTLLVVSDEQTVLAITHSCSGLQKRGIEVAFQSNGSRHFYDTTASHLSVIYGYFRHRLECSNFISEIFSATPTHPVTLTIQQNADTSQTIQVNNSTYTVRRESFLNPFL
jgi:hypothetical protein